MLWMDNEVYILLQQRRLFLCVLFVLFRAAECAQPLWTGEWNSGWCCMWRTVGYLNSWYFGRKVSVLQLIYLLIYFGLCLPWMWSETLNKSNISHYYVTFIQFWVKLSEIESAVVCCIATSVNSSSCCSQWQ